MTLSTRSNFADPDTAYRLLVEAHRGLSDEESAMLDTALVLLLANHIGDADVLREGVPGMCTGLEVEVLHGASW
jgi:hypothetical protein